MSYPTLSKIEYEAKLHTLFPDEDFTVIAYTNAQSSVDVRCNTCGTIYHNERGRGFYNNKHICRHCGTKTFQIFLQKCKQDNLTVLQLGKRNRDDTTLQCNDCQGIFTKHVDDVAKDKTPHILCPYCKSTVPNHKYFNPQKRLDDAFGKGEYTVVSDNNYAEKKILIKHNKCGFIHSAKIGNFERSNGCPKCYGKRSRGELRIAAVLKRLNISYVEEYPIPQRQRLDFFVNNDFAIEFNGPQHYEDIQMRNKYDTLENNKRRDEQKAQWCKTNNIDLLIIPYYDYDNVEQIITNFLAQRPGYEAVGKD